MTHPFQLRLRPGAAFERDSDGGLAVRPTREDLEGGAPVEYVALIEGETWLSLQPLLLPYTLRYQPLADDEATLRLSRLAVQRRRGTALVWETPLSAALLRTCNPRLDALWPLLAKGGTLGELSHRVGLPMPTLRLCIELALCAGVVTSGQANVDEGTALSDDAVDGWSAHEAWFHARSRFGRHDGPIGGTYPRPDLAAPPGRRPSHSESRIALPVPAAPAGDAPTVGLWHALRERRSARDFEPARPLTLDQLGAFLFYCGRVTSQTPRSRPDGYDVIHHPYPTAGGMGAMELYLALGRCEHVPEGLYHYDAFDHALVDVACASVEGSLALRRATQRALGASQPPAATMLITCRMPLLLWKYRSIAYELALKNVGALFQTAYLAAYGLGLSACAAGCGDSDRFASDTGIDYWAEPLVGEFAFGLPPFHTHPSAGAHA